MYSEYHLVQKCLATIEEKLGWGNSKDWHNEVFTELSEEIQKETHVLLSPTTLKRVWGRVKYQSVPSTTTLNVLSKFAGFENWRDFKNSKPYKKKVGLKTKISANLGIIMLSASVMTVVFISFFSLRGSRDALRDIDVSQIPFSSQPLAKGLPNSVVFNFDLSSIPSDSIHIQQYWDETKTIKLNKGQKQATGQYYYPGYFRAKLVVDGKQIKQHDLFIKSEGWLGTLRYEPIPKYIKTPLNSEGYLGFDQEVLKEIQSSEQPLVSAYHYVEKFKEVSGDNFTLNTSFRNVYSDKWAVCQITYIVVLGTKSAFVIPFAIPGCTSEIGIMLSDFSLDGKEHDLSALSSDFTNFKDISIRVEEQQVKIAIEGKQVFSQSYSEAIGDLAGIRLRFLGAGEVREVEIRDAVDDLKYRLRP